MDKLTESSEKEKPTRKAVASSARARVSRVAQRIAGWGKSEPIAASPDSYIGIDFPRKSEVLCTPDYAIRLGVGGADLVEMSIDKSPWHPCRMSEGFWWYDWSRIPLGKHKLVARMRLPNGRWVKSAICPCKYGSE